MSVLHSNAEKIISSIGFLIKIKTKLQILTLKIYDRKTGCDNRLTFLDSFLSFTEVEDKIIRRPLISV